LEEHSYARTTTGWKSATDRLRDWHRTCRDRSAWQSRFEILATFDRTKINRRQASGFGHVANSPLYSLSVQLSVVIITHNEEANIGRTLASVQSLVADGKGEMIVVDSGSTDRTVEIAKAMGAKVFIEEWKGYAAQKNSAFDKAQGDWVLSLDADEEVETDLLAAMETTFAGWAIVDAYARPKGYSPRSVHGDFKIWHELDDANSLNTDCYFDGFLLRRKNLFLGKWIKHGGFWPDPKLRLFRRGLGRVEERVVHETVTIDKGIAAPMWKGALLHHSYPILSDYLDHMNRYSSLGAEMVAAKGQVRFSVFNIVLRPAATFVYNYFFRLGFLDGREGLLLHLYHAVYVSWKYAKAWEISREADPSPSLRSGSG
jgi:glycosyltransferase involved in cell wall biosynthesis